MASLRPPGTSKHWFGRGRRKDGTQFEFSTEILVEPEGVAPENLPQKRAENKKRAKEVADDIEARERGSMKEEEFEARMKHRVRKVLQQNSSVPPVVFLVAWAWESASWWMNWGECRSSVLPRQPRSPRKAGMWAPSR